MKRFISLCMLWLAFPSDGVACKYQVQDLGDSIGQAHEVFVARAETASNGKSGRGGEVPALMRVTEVIKGRAKAGQQVPVFTSNSSCGLGIERGQLWLIVANGEPLRSDEPSGSVLLADQAARNMVSAKFHLKLEQVK